MISGSPIRWKQPPQRSFLHNPWLSRCTTNDCWSTARLWAQVSDLTTRTATVQTWNQCLLITNTTIIPQSKRHDLCFSELVCDMEMFKLIGSWCCYSVQVLGILLKPSKRHHLSRHLLDGANVAMTHKLLMRARRLLVTIGDFQNSFIHVRRCSSWFPWQLFLHSSSFGWNSHWHHKLHPHWRCPSHASDLPSIARWEWCQLSQFTVPESLWKSQKVSSFDVHHESWLIGSHRCLVSDPSKSSREVWQRLDRYPIVSMSMSIMSPEKVGFLSAVTVKLNCAIPRHETRRKDPKAEM